MESPQLVSNTTTDSIASQLYGTHINRTPASAGAAAKGMLSSVYAAIYAEQQFIQFSMNVVGAADATVMVLRRVEDSYVNVSQMLQVLVMLNYFTSDQISAFIDNEIVSNPQYLPEHNSTVASVFADLSDHEVPQIRGIWVPYDKAVAIAVKFDLYKTLRKLFLVDVHDYDKLPKYDLVQTPVKAEKRNLDPSLEESPSKKRKSSVSISKKKAENNAMLESILAANTNNPSSLPALFVDETHRELIVAVKAQFSEIFKTDGKDAVYTSDDISSRFCDIIRKCQIAKIKPSSVIDIPLDLSGRTALHYASTLASTNLVGAFIELEYCSPIRGDNTGESPLVATIQVTNSMEKGNFMEVVDNWLWPDLWLFDNKHQSILHHIVLVATNNFKSAKFYFGKLLEWVISNPDKKKNLFSLCEKIINAKESQDGSTALHWAGNNELKWFVFLLLELNADPEIKNNFGVKPADFDSVKQVMALRNKFKESPKSPLSIKTLLVELGANNDTDEYLLLLLMTGVEFLARQASFPSVGVLEDKIVESSGLQRSADDTSSVLHSSRLLSSIQELLATTNLEFEKVINAKKAEINSLNSELRDATILTANNRFVIKKVSEKINSIDSLKLQLANVNEKLDMLKTETGNAGKEEQSADAETGEFDADEPFIVAPIYEKVIKDEKIEATPELIATLPSVKELKAQLAAYEELNSSLEREAECLLDYSSLTSKFKKVVSFCTGVNVDEVDDLLDGLLEAIEGQQ